MYTPIWNAILSILRSQNYFHSTEIHLGSQNWKDYISNGCVHPLLKWDLCSDGVKFGLDVQVYNILDPMQYFARSTFYFDNWYNFFFIFQEPKQRLERSALMLPSGLCSSVSSSSPLLLLTIKMFLFIGLSGKMGQDPGWHWYFDYSHSTCGLWRFLLHRYSRAGCVSSLF